MINTKIKRDDLLDIAKGIGIMLVVLGHTLQRFYTDFDHNIVFRMIYSFHMPLFFFISGAVLCIKNDFTQRPYQANQLHFTQTQLFINRCKKSFLHLMVPFLVWTIILFFTGKIYEQVGFFGWILMVIKSADFSLWFLIAIFHCLFFFYTSQYLFSVLRFDISPKFSRLTSQHKQILFLVTSLLFFVVAAKLLPNWLGVSFFKHYYPYIIFGGMWQVYFRHISPKLSSILALLIFCLLAPYWYRIEPNPMSATFSGFIFPTYSEVLYKLTVALSGTLTTLTLASLIQNAKFGGLKKTFTYCGTMSLGIYAFHSHFLGIKPYFIAPLLISMVICFYLVRLPYIRALLLGLQK